MSYWGEHARAVIAEAVARGLEVGEGLPAITARIDAAYPFGPREHWPYKVWLRERRRVIGELARANPTPANRACAACGRGPAQPCRDIATGHDWPAGSFHVARLGQDAPGDSGPLFGGEADRG